MIKLNVSSDQNASNLIVLAHSGSDLNKIAGIQSDYLNKKIQSEENGSSFSSVNDKLVYAVYANKKADTTNQSFQDYRVLGSQITKAVNAEKLESLTVLADSDISKESVMAFLEGMCLENYQYLQFKTDKIGRTHV